MEEALRASTGYLLHRVGADSRRRWTAMLAGHGLTPHHFGVLMALDHAGATNQRRLSELIGIDPRNAVPIVDLLQRRGLLERDVDPADRRRYALTLTPAGRRVLATLRDDGDEVEAAMLAGLTPAEQAALHALLATLMRTLTAGPAGPAGR
jgi:DNA-binding MarR family transcriptional regulator